jgi:hypothetical protein
VVKNFEEKKAQAQRMYGARQESSGGAYNAPESRIALDIAETYQLAYIYKDHEL